MTEPSVETKEDTAQKIINTFIPEDSEHWECMTREDLRKALSTQQAQMRERVRKLITKHSAEGVSANKCEYNQAIKDVLAILKEECE